MPMPDALTREIGPLPVWGWGVALVAGGGLALAINRRRSAPAVVAPESEAAWSSPGLSAFPSPGAYGAGGTIGVPSGVVPTAPTGGAPEITTNSEWRAAALRLLTSQGADSLAVDQALARYLQGRQLTSSEQAIVAEALRRIGAPPDAAPVQPDPIPADPGPPPPDPNAIANDPDPRSRAIREAYLDVLGRDPGPQAPSSYWYQQITSGAITGPIHLRNALAATDEGLAIF